MEVANDFQLWQQGVDGCPESTCALSVDYADLENAFFLTELQIVGNQIFDVLRAKLVEIQLPINGIFNWLHCGFSNLRLTVNGL